VDAQQDWSLSDCDECYICEKHHYTTIFYERSNSSNFNTSNYGLVEVKDIGFLNDLRAEFNRNLKYYKNNTPLICGSVVNKSAKQKVFDRKLKMYPAPLYSLLQIC
jgi:hypothetical protein